MPTSQDHRLVVTLLGLIDQEVTLYGTPFSLVASIERIRICDIA